MAKYKISKKADMRRFQDDIEQSVLDAEYSALRTATYTVKCTRCEKLFDAVPGENTCPHCGNNIRVDLNFNR